MNIETNKLGLPLEYQILPELFDAHNITNKTKATINFIHKLLSQYGVKTVLDLSCGTGSQVFFLNKLGYKVTGADRPRPILYLSKNVFLPDGRTTSPNPFNASTQYVLI